MCIRDRLTAGPHFFQARCVDSLGQATISNVVSLTLSSPGPPPPVDVVFAEVEPNWQNANAVATTYNVIRGVTQPGDDDWFAIAPQAGKQVCVAGAVTNGSSCTPDLALYVSSQGVPVFRDAMFMLPSRGAITSSDYICSFPGDNGVVYITVDGQIFCSPVGYDILVKFQ